MIDRLPLREHVAREMFADYKARVNYWEKDKARQGWDDGSAFHSSAAKQPWLDRADIAIASYEEWYK